MANFEIPIKVDTLELAEEHAKEIYKQVRADAIDEFADALKDYIYHKKVQGIEPYWSVAIREVAEQLKENSQGD